jgi:dipeptidyl aminopeptidase/acylaminoacyl peptidase
MANDLRRGLALTIVAIGLPALAQRPAAWTAEAVVDIQAVSDAQVSPDGRTVAFVRSAWCGGQRCSGVWRAAVADGSERRIDSAEADETRPRWSPDGSRLAFLSRRAGVSRLLVTDPSGGDSASAAGNVLDFAWAPDGRRLAGLVEESGQTSLRILEAASLRWLSGPSAQPRSIQAFAWSADGAALIAAAPSESSAGTDRILVLPLAGPARTLATVEGRVSALAVSDDGATAAWLAQPTGAVFVAPIAGGATRRFALGSHESALGIAWKSDGRLAVSLRSGIQASVDLWSTTGARRESVAPIGMLAVSGRSSWAAAGEPFVLAASTAEHPAEAFVGLLARPIPPGPDTVGAPPPPLRRLTQSNPQLAVLPFGRQEIVRYRSPRGVEQEGLLIHPSRAAQGRLPLVVGRVGRSLLDGWTTDVRFPARALAELGLYVLEVPSAAALDELSAGADSLAAVGLSDSGRVALVCDDPALAAAAAASGRFAIVALIGTSPSPGSAVLAFRIDPGGSRAEQIEGLRRLLEKIPARLAQGR